MKYESLYSEGMKPLVFSTIEHESSSSSWHRDCYNIGYYQNSFPRKAFLPSQSRKYSFFYTLTFTYTFDQVNDLVFFAYSYPYTYADLSSYLAILSANPKCSKFMRVNTLCHTLGKNPCHILTITENISSYTSWEEEATKLQKTAAGRRYMKLKELKEESKVRMIDYYKGNKNEEGKR